MDTREHQHDILTTYTFPKPDSDLDDAKHELAAYRYKAEVDAYKAHLAAVDTQKAAAGAVQADKEKAAAAVLADQAKAQAAVLAYQLKVAVANDFAQRQAVFTAYVDVVKGQIDRAQARAEFIQTAAAAVGTLYTGVLAFTIFGKGIPATSNTLTTSGTGIPGTSGISATAGITGTTPLSTTTTTIVQGASGLPTIPTQGIVAPIFLGLAIVCATGYLAYFRDARLDQQAEQNTEKATTPESDLAGLIWWTNRIVNQRTVLLRMAIVGFAYGVVTLSLAFIAPLPGTGILLILVLGLLCMVVIPRIPTQILATETPVVPHLNGTPPTYTTGAPSSITLDLFRSIQKDMLGSLKEAVAEETSDPATPQKKD